MRVRRISSVSAGESSRTAIFWKRRSSAGSPRIQRSYSSSVVAPSMRNSPRASAGLSMLAASIAEPLALPCPIRLCISSTNSSTSPAALVSATRARRRSSYWPRYVVPARSATESSDSRRKSRMATGTVPAAMRCASPSAMAVLPTPAAPTSAGLFFPCRRRMSIVRAISSSRQRTVSRRPARASVVRSRVKRASAPESERSERKESSITTRGFAGSEVRGFGATPKRARGSGGRKEVATHHPRRGLDGVHRSVRARRGRCFLPRARPLGSRRLVWCEEDASEQTIAPDQHHRGRRREEDAEGHERKPQGLLIRTERQLRLRGGAASAEHRDRVDDREEGNRTDRRADEHRGDRACGAERGTDERHERHVAHAH